MVQPGDASVSSPSTSSQKTGKKFGEKPEPRPPLSWHLPVLQLAAIILALDQFTKYLVRELLTYRASFPDTGFFRFTHTHNTGSAFGIFQGQNSPLIFVSFIGIAVLLVIYFSQPRPGNLLRLSLGLQMGGAVGNLVDRLHQGWVTDFIDVGPWPVFNLADASIVTGLIMLAWIFLRPAPTVAPERRSAPAQGWASEPNWCPICDGDMVVLANGWRCADCGVRERVELPQPSSLTIPPIQTPAFMSVEAGLPAEPNPAVAFDSNEYLDLDSVDSLPRPSPPDISLSEEQDSDLSARQPENPATGSSPPGLSQPGLEHTGLSQPEV